MLVADKIHFTRETKSWRKDANAGPITVADIYILAGLACITGIALHQPK